MAAGLGFKTFTTGEVLTAADTNGYLMQGVLVFASAAARDAAITSPQEGQCCYLKDTDAVLTYSGAAWVGFDDSNAIQNSIVDAKGDLISATADNTPARLAVGSNGETLVANSAASTGLSYSATPSASNPFLNSAFQVWQRGTSVSIASATKTYAADRWYFYQSGPTATVSRQATGDTTNLPSIQYGCRYQRNSGQTGTGALQMQQPVETLNAVPFAGKTVTMSFYAKCGANYSSASSALTVQLLTGTGTDQDGLGGYTGSATAATTTVTLTTTYQRFTVTGTIASTATEFMFYALYTPVGTAGANDWFEITGVQIDVGSVALPFRTNGGTIQGELAACQRYCLSFLTGTSEPVGIGINYSATELYTIISFPVTMRTTPTGVIASGSLYYGFFRNGAPDYFNSFTLTDATPQTAQLANTTEISGTAGDAGVILTQNAAASILFSAEL